MDASAHCAEMFVTAEVFLFCVFAAELLSVSPTEESPDVSGKFMTSRQQQTLIGSLSVRF